jgi:hypothetical protein
MHLEHLRLEPCVLAYMAVHTRAHALPKHACNFVVWQREWVSLASAPSVVRCSSVLSVERHNIPHMCVTLQGTYRKEGLVLDRVTADPPLFLNPVPVLRQALLQPASSTQQHRYTRDMSSIRRPAYAGWSSALHVSNIRVIDSTVNKKKHYRVTM